MTVNFTFDRMTLPFRTEFSLAGTRCILSTNSHHVLRHCLPWQSIEPLAEANSIRMEILEDASTPQESTKPAHFRGLRHLVFVMLEPNGFLNFDLIRKRIMGVISSATARNAQFWNSQLLPMSIGLLGTTVGVAPLHSACLDRNGVGLLITGKSGAGKSTLTAALAKRGFSVVSDDWTYVSQRGGTLNARGLFAPIKLLPETVRFFPELIRYTPRKTWNGEIAHEIDPVKDLRCHTSVSTQPNCILFLERTSVPGCRFVPCRPEYLQWFFESSSEKLPLEVPDAIKNRSQIIRQLSSCKSWMLHTGDDPLRTAAAIDEFLHTG